MKTKLSNNGFGLIGTLVVIVGVGVIGIAGWAVYSHDRKGSNNSALTINNDNSNKNTKDISQTTNIYAGWKSYCDTVYDYCFKYPTTWSVSSMNPATTLGSEGGIMLLSPGKAVEVTYSNDFVKDSNSISFMPSILTKLTNANQDLTLVGGYIPSSGDNGLAGNDIPSYQVVDSSILATYPLTVGRIDEFTANPSFTDQGKASPEYKGSFASKPSVTINSVQETKSWLNSLDAKTSVQILESLYYN